MTSQLLETPAALQALTAAAAIVYRYFKPTPQSTWPLLSQRCGSEVWVKHENQTPVGAFKIRGGLVYMTRLRERSPHIDGIVTATRGNHGQSIAYAAARLGYQAIVVVPESNCPDKNAAMRALGADLREIGHDFQVAIEAAKALAAELDFHFIPSFHPDLVAGVASYSLEFLTEAPALDTVYVPIGMGSGICGMIAAREALGLATEIVGVVTQGAPAYALSFACGELMATDSAHTLADGLACRTPNPEAFATIRKHVSRIVTVSDAEILAAMRHYFSDTHNVAEGAGAAPLAALLQERDRMAGKRVGLILSGGNVAADLYGRALTSTEPVMIPA